MDKRDIRSRERKTGHAVFSPSQLYRVLACPASAREATYAPITPPSIYAEQGTMKHGVVSDILLNKITEQHSRFKGLELEDQNDILDCLDYVKLLRSQAPESELASNKIEERVNLSAWGLDEIWGTADFQLAYDHTIHVVDWKFGSGVQVFAQNNEQGMAYAAGAVGYPSHFKDIHIHVVQPPLNHFDEWIITYDELGDWVFNVLEPGINAARQDNAPYNPGEKQCKFCPASMTCRARHESALAAAAEVFRTYSELPQVTPRELANALEKIHEMQQYAKDIQVFAQSELMHGREVPGYKLVHGRSIRKWMSDKDAEEWLLGNSDIAEEDMFTKKFISPAQAEKLDRRLKKEKTHEFLVTKPPGKPQLVGDDDPRKAIDPHEAASVFQDKI